MITLRSNAALITDIHANEEAFIAILEDIKKRNVDYIFSLGDIVGLGPNPRECLNLAMQNNVINILGNNDYYNILPFDTYNHLKYNKESESYQNALWTKQQLTKNQIAYLRQMPPSIDLQINNHLIALCHFPTDVRYFPSAVWTYEVDGTEILNRTNTPLDEKYKLSSKNKGVILSNQQPLFNGKTTNQYDGIIFGHYHFERDDLKKDGNVTNFHSLNASGVAIEDYTMYYLLSPTKKGYQIKRIMVPYDRQKLYDKLDQISYPKQKTFEEYIMKF